MEIDTSNLNGTNAAGAVTEAVNGSSAKVWALRMTNMTGSFALSFDNDTMTSGGVTRTTSLLPSTVSASALATALMTLNNVGFVQVEKHQVRMYVCMYVCRVINDAHWMQQGPAML